MTLLRSFGRDTRGNIAIMSGLVLSIVLGMAAFGVDVGRVFTERRKAQSVADLAAIAAAADLPNSVKAATATAERNSFPATSVQEVLTGTYKADPGVAPANRFAAGNSPTANAAKVSIQTTTALIFGRLLAGRDHFDIRTTATATQTAFASFAVGSGLVSLNGGLLNQILGAMLGVNLSLSAMDYQALANTNISMPGFAGAMASRLNITAGTYNSVFGSSAKIGQVLGALADTGQAQYGKTAAVQALGNVAGSVQSANTKVPLAPLANFGPYGDLRITQNPQVNVMTSALDVLSAAAQLANGTNQVAIALDAGIPGIAGATLQLTIGERPKGTSWTAVGTAGASAYTAQTRLLLTVTLAGEGSIASVKLPLYLELASASATVEAVKCSYPNPSASTVTLSVQPALLNAWIGNVTPSMMSNFSSPPSPGPAKLVDTALLDVSGLAHATATNMARTSVVFRQSDIAQQTKKTTSTTNIASSLLSSLIGNLTITVNVGGLNLGLPGVVNQSVAGIVAKAAQPIDQLLASVLGSLGIQAGQASTWVTGIRCDGAVLVN